MLEQKSVYCVTERTVFVCVTKPEVSHVRDVAKKFYQPRNHKLQAGSWPKKILSHEAAGKF